ncbi:MFS transporter [Cryptosporangium arvum]|uniref:Arabinose efflux permease family protein n=1 Tax=Cryptosporangium arvum DSM 44712 TaxID=927661 RepID=A0A010Z3U9_9ACTN|nr:MFS transporter [Cryptosporangium arvum]EXG82068.1 arabinose efflux permease family protein [Cryptosporangium arvum DSM 44712]
MAQRPALSSRREIGTASRRELGWALGVLCLTEIVSWGVLYYAFPVLAADITADTGWSTAAITAAFSAGLVVSALVGIPVGRVIHRHGPRWLMTGGSALAVTAVVLLAVAPSFPLFLAGWLLAGVAMSCVLYAPAFAAVTVWFGPRRVRALTAITLVAGFASTVFAPLTAVLDQHLCWRATYLVLAGVLAVLTVPTHWFGLRPAWPNTEQTENTTSTDDTRANSRPVRPLEFWVLAAAFTVNTVCLYAAVINLVPLLHGRGYSLTAAAWVLGIGGVGQVLGRLAYAPLVRRTGLTACTLAVFTTGAVTTGVFAVLPGPYAALIVVALIAGNARGLATLLSATAVSDRWGTARFARLNGVFNAPMMLATAVSPFIGAWLAGPLGGYPEAFAALAVLGLVAVMLAARRAPTEPRG